MKRIHSIICACAVGIGFCVCAWAEEPAALLAQTAQVVKAVQPGTTCHSALELEDDYSASIEGPYPKTVWYTAWTFDLPLSVYFIPENETDPAPEVEMDFSCSTGVYSDPLICMLFCRGGMISMPIPHKPLLETTTIDGHFAYYLSVGKSYRDLLLKMGIDYNVEVFVKVTYNSSGTFSIAPDDMFSNCMDGPKFMHLGDTVQVKPLDKERHVIVPYVQWQEDSIRYVWEGTAPVEVAVGNTCDYDPTDAGNTHRLDYFVLQPKDTLKMTSDEVKHYIQDDVSSEAGMFFAKFYTEGTGTIKIERLPLSPPRGNATLLHYNKATSIAANDDKLYAIPDTWNTATKFISPTDHIFRMSISTDPDFEAYPPHTYQFNRTDTSHWYGLKDAEMQALWKLTKEKYLYVRFECTAKTTVTPEKWAVSSCVETIQELQYPSSTVTVRKNDYVAVYFRFYYPDWKGGEMKFEWQGAVKCKTSIGDTCHFSTSAYDNHVNDYQEISANGSWNVSPEQMVDMDWGEAVDEDGYLYIRFNASKQGIMTVTSAAPPEEDPAPIVYPAATISMECDGEQTSDGQKFIVRVSKDQTLELYQGEITNIVSGTIDTWPQTKDDTHPLTLQTGVYTLKGEKESIQIVVE